jgi:hypothetical protein
VWQQVYQKIGDVLQALFQRFPSLTRINPQLPAGFRNGLENNFMVTRNLGLNRPS